MRHKLIIVLLALTALAAALILFNYFLWNLQKNKKESIANLAAQVSARQDENKKLKNRNDSILNKVKELQSADAYATYEAKAREDYGMIGDNETAFVVTLGEIDTIVDIPGLDKFIQDYYPNSSDAIAVRHEQDDAIHAADPPVEILKLESIGE